MEKKFKRQCPKCGKDIFHTKKGNMKTAEKAERQCRECLGKQQSVEFSGSGNPFFGKTHSDETKCKLGKYDRSEETKELARQNLKKNSNTRYPYEIWIEKFGLEEANIRLAELKNKLSIANSGSNNPMYGKPAPEGSGNGWSGWYKDWYFRSLRELSYMINEIEQKSLSWQSAEKKELQIKYIDWKGLERTYTADFLIENKYLVECKPLKLMSSDNVKRKSEAAKLFCSAHGYEYILIEPEILSKEKIKELYIKKEIVFTERYRIKMEDYLNE